MVLDIRTLSTEVRENLYKNFMALRFPTEPKDSPYSNEWVIRFVSGHPDNYMDEDSLKVWNELIKELK